MENNGENIEQVEEWAIGLGSWETFGNKDDSENKIKEKKQSRRTTECLELSTNYIYRRAFSELNLINCVDILKENHSYNFITGGDVDSLSYLKLVLRFHDLDYVLISTWCMAAEDVLQIKNWFYSGKIKKIDFYLGEIFPNSYKIEYKMILDFIKESNCGRVAIFKNHSKIFAGYNKKDSFYFGCQSSANINTNPRTENGCITINEDIFNFYKSFFDEINSFC